MTKTLEEKLNHGDLDDTLTPDERSYIFELMDHYDNAHTQGYDKCKDELLLAYSKIFVSLSDDARSSPEVEEMIGLLNGVFGY